jgi:hypothetical protein
MRIHVLTLVLALLPMGTGAAEIAADPLETLAWLVGTWRAEASTADGNPETTEVTFQWTAHKRAIQYSIVRTSNGKTVPALAGICGWHPVKKRFVLWEMDGEGNLTEGQFLAGEGKHSYEEVIHGVDGSTLPVRAEALRQGEDAFRFNASVETGGEWAVVFQRTYLRVK